MSKYLCLFVVLLAVSVYSKEENIGTSVQSVKNITDFVAQNPEAKIVPLARTGVQRKIHYVIGQRVPGDVVVGSTQKQFFYQQPQNVQQKLWYPQSGLGARVSLVDIWVEQTSDIGNAYVVSGGIGYRSITVVIEAKYTTLLTYAATVYGY